MANKTDKYINLIIKISNSRNWEISEEQLKETLESPSKSQYYNYLQDLLTETSDRPAILTKLVRENRNFYKLSENTWSHFFIAKEEGEFLLQVHRQLGYLIENGLHDLDINFSKKNRNNFERKFFYLSTIKGKAFSTDQKENLHLLIKSLISNKVLQVLYNDKYYIVSPLSLCQYRDDLYLIASKGKFFEDNFRHFKLSRIKSIVILDESFRYPKETIWNPKEYFKDSSGIITGDSKKATISVKGYAKKLLNEKNFFSSTLVKKTELFDQYELSYTSEEEFLGQLFIYADEIIIDSPSYLRERFLNKAKSCIQNNSIQNKKVA